MHYSGQCFQLDSYCGQMPLFPKNWERTSPGCLLSLKLPIEGQVGPTEFYSWTHSNHTLWTNIDSLRRTSRTQNSPINNLSMVEPCLDQELLLFWLRPSCCAVLVVIAKRLTTNTLEEICFFIVPIVMLNSWVTGYNPYKCVVWLSIHLRISSW